MPKTLSIILALGALLLATTGMADRPRRAPIDGQLNPERASSVLDEIALNIAAVAWNEASVRASRDEARAIFHTQWTVAGGADATPEEVLRAQRLLSKRVTGVRPALNRGNERWSRNLRWNSDEPEGWEVTGLPWDRHSPRWDRMREVISGWVEEHFSGEPVRQCRGTPKGWGGPRVDENRLRARNRARRERGRDPFYVLDCGRTVNGFFGIPRRGSAYRTTLATR